MDIRHIPGRVNPADTLTRQIWVEDQEQAELVRTSDQTMVQRLHIPDTATDAEIQRRLNSLYNMRNEEERRMRAREQILGGQPMEQNEETAALCITESRVQVDRGFKNSLWQQVVTDEEYGAIVNQLQHPAKPNEIPDQWKNKYRIKQGVLKIHQEEQNKMYQYWRSVIPDHHQTKMQVLKEIHCVPYSGHPGYVRTLDLAKQHFYWKQMSQDVRDFVIHCPVCQTEKSSHQKPTGMLMPLELPERK